MVQYYNLRYRRHPGEGGELRQGLLDLRDWVREPPNSEFARSNIIDYLEYIKKNNLTRDLLYVTFSGGKHIETMEAGWQVKELRNQEDFENNINYYEKVKKYMDLKSIDHKRDIEMLISFEQLWNDIIKKFKETSKANAPPVENNTANAPTGENNTANAPTNEENTTCTIM